jgi:hypothetical protein
MNTDAYMQVNSHSGRAIQVLFESLRGVLKMPFSVTLDASHVSFAFPDTIQVKKHPKHIKTHHFQGQNTTQHKKQPIEYQYFNFKNTTQTQGKKVLKKA